MEPTGKIAPKKNSLRSLKVTGRLLLLVAVLALAIGCQSFREIPITRKNALERLMPSAYPVFSDDLTFEEMTDAISQSLSFLKKLPPDREFQFGADRYRADHLIQSFERFQKFIEQTPSGKALERFVEKNYVVYRSVGSRDSGDVLFTGYYEPSLHGSLSRNDEYRYPLYVRPDDLVSIDLSLFSPKYQGERITGRYTGRTVLPYYDRNEIDRLHRLKGNVAALAWVDDPIDLFFLHIQGSGKILLDDGTFIRVHYDGANGRPYKSIGKLLIDTGKIEKSEMSAQKIRSYLRENPAEIAATLDFNPSYVFFKIEEDGPIGCLGIRLTPARSLALDRRLFPLPALAFIQSQKPVVDDRGNIQRWIDFNRFVVSQDTGGAIRGPGRADLFWGSGAYAETAAGHMQHSGQLYILVLKQEH